MLEMQLLADHLEAKLFKTYLWKIKQQQLYENN